MFFWSLMIHVKIVLFNTFTFIFIQLSHSTAIILASTLPLNQLIAIIALDIHFKSLSVFLSFTNILKKDLKKLWLFIPQRGKDSCVSTIAKSHYSTEILFYTPLPPKKLLVLHWFGNLSQCNVTHKNQLLFLHRESSLKWVQVLKRNSLLVVMVTKLWSK